MKVNLLFFTFVTFFFLGTASAQYINWGADPMNINYNGAQGKITLKLLYETKVITEGASGKFTTGLARPGLIVDVDSADFFTPGKKIGKGTVYACGNFSEFPDYIDRSRVLVVKRVIVNNEVKFVQDPKLQLIAEELNLLQNKIVSLEGYVSSLTKKIDGIQIPREKTSSESSATAVSNSFPWLEVIVAIVAATALGIGIALLVTHHNHDDNGHQVATTGGTPPSGVTGPVFKIFLQTVGRMLGIGAQLSF